MVLVVEEADPDNQYYYDLVRDEAAKLFSDDLRLMLPVYFEASQYPKGYAFQIDPEIGSRLEARAAS